MKVLTLRQPEATAVVLGLVRSIYRGKDLSYRGPLLIHAACRRPGFKERRRFPDLKPDLLTYSAIIGAVDLLGCVQTESGCGFDWYLGNPRRLVKPFPCIGMWKLWEAPANFVWKEAPIPVSDNREK